MTVCPCVRHWRSEAASRDQRSALCLEFFDCVSYIHVHACVYSHRYNVHVHTHTVHVHVANMLRVHIYSACGVCIPVCVHVLHVCTHLSTCTFRHVLSATVMSLCNMYMQWQFLSYLSLSLSLSLSLFLSLSLSPPGLR